MKRLGILAATCLFSFLLVFCAGCGESDRPGEEENTTDPMTTETGTTCWEEPPYVFPTGPEGLDMVVFPSHIYQSIGELYGDADCVIIGRVYLQEFDKTDEGGYSYAQVWVEQTIKGDSLSESMITVREHGTESEVGTASVGRVPLLREGECVLLFLQNKVELPAPWKKGYVTVGDYQGKFFYQKEEDCWYASGLLGEIGDLLSSDAKEPLSNADMAWLLHNMGYR